MLGLRREWKDAARAPMQTALHANAARLRCRHRGVRCRKYRQFLIRKMHRMDHLSLPDLHRVAGWQRRQVGRGGNVRRPAECFICAPSKSLPASFQHSARLCRQQAVVSSELSTSIPAVQVCTSCCQCLVLHGLHLRTQMLDLPSVDGCRHECSAC